ncbi:MAG: DUF262 domain-containing HNH endonuclease family protein [Bryobacteraceae bacterium]|nr:DUF262 domain-containing HNH endonuclease family protein [Bryobacteraceae bacterium]
MKAEERTISNILTEQICYEIPPYQRPYSWEKENVQQLLDDIWEGYKENDTEYFIGSLITIEKERDRYDVVDGQQRLTTLNLILARMRDHIHDDAAKADLGKRILPRNVYTGEAESPRLLLREKDRMFFRKHVLEAQSVPEEKRDQLEAPKRRLIENGQAVDEFCQAKSETDLKLFANFLLSRVYVVFVTTPSWQSAYRLFNVLNARGIPLSNADLIKNTLFEFLGTQTNLSGKLEDLWLQLEGEVGIERLDSFFGHHRTSVIGAKSRGSLHEEIKPLVQAHVGGPLSFIESVISSGKNYMRIVEGDFDDAATMRAIRSLQRVDHNDWHPPLLAFLNHPVAGIVVAEFARSLEKITIQNWVRRLGRTARLTVYYQLVGAMKSGKMAEDIRQIFRNNAQNAEFIHLLGADFYGRPFDEAVLLGLEEASQDESVTKIFSGRLTIEHVLPQAMKDDYWSQRFSEDEHSLWLHRLGNLALLSGNKNYKAQNYDFDKKKEVYGERNRKVSFDLTKEICDQQEWTVSAIQTRHDRLLKLAATTWEIV